MRAIHLSEKLLGDHLHPVTGDALEFRVDHGFGPGQAEFADAGAVFAEGAAVAVVHGVDTDDAVCKRGVGGVEVHRAEVQVFPDDEAGFRHGFGEAGEAVEGVVVVVTADEGHDEDELDAVVCEVVDGEGLGQVVGKRQEACGAVVDDSVAGVFDQHLHEGVELARVYAGFGHDVEAGDVECAVVRQGAVERVGVDDLPTAADVQVVGVGCGDFGFSAAAFALHDHVGDFVHGCVLTLV